MKNHFSRIAAVITATFLTYFSVVAVALVPKSTTTNTEVYQITNDTPIKIGVAFYYNSKMLKSDSFSVYQTKSITTSKSINYINVQPLPEISWSGPVIRFDKSKVQNKNFVVTFVRLSSDRIKLEVRSSEVLIGSGEFTEYVENEANSVES